MAERKKLGNVYVYEFTLKELLKKLEIKEKTELIHYSYNNKKLKIFIEE